MIAVNSFGRLGNNMFQWAFGVSASRRLGTEFVMSDDLLSPLFELDGSTGMQRRLHRLRWLAEFGLRRMPVIEQTNDDDPESLLSELRDGARYSGWFQSADYLSGSEGAVRRALAVRPEHRLTFEQRYADLPERYACVHIRLRDYLEFRLGEYMMGGGVGIALPESYFRRCLDRIDPDLPVIFTSDDITAVEAAFGSQPNARFESNEAIVDLQLMINAQTCITSNSSFAWWGAWLNERPDKRVLAPRYWIGFSEGREWPRRVLPDGWEQVEVEARQGAWRDRLGT